MHISDAQAEPLKAWLVTKLDDISDAESDVLADYVMALLRTDEPVTDAQMKVKCTADLEEFLKDNTTKFVDEVLSAVHSGSYDPKNAIQVSAQPLASSFASNQSRKRSFNDGDTEMQDAGPGQGGRGGAAAFGRGGGDGRPAKHMRRGNGFEQRGGGRFGRGGMHAGGQMGGMPHMPGMPPMDPSNPMAALLAMQAMMSNMQGMPDMQFNNPPKHKGERCQDYDTKGFCALGVACPYDHGTDHLVVAGQGQNQSQDQAQGSGEGNIYFAHNGRGQGFQSRGRGRGGRGDSRGRGGPAGGGGGSHRGGRAAFSSAAPNSDQSITSVVVENIPEDKCSDESIRKFFAQFGTIEEILLQEQRRLAIIKYSDYSSAKSAYDSPKVIFDNRFVKVYWHRPEESRPRKPYDNGRPFQARNGSSQDVSMQQDDPAVDQEELARKQQEAQRLHEEKMGKIKAARSQREELDAKLKAQEAERAALMAKLASKTGGAMSGDATMSVDSSTADGKHPGPEAQAKTAALKAKLAALEDDARSMGINPSEDGSGEFVPRGRGRGGGGFRGRGMVRGIWRGRGRGAMGPTARGGGSVMRLDNRPKTISVVLPKGQSMGGDVDEALKQFLLFSNLMESATIQAHAHRSDAVLVSFTERYKAEAFLQAAHKEIPHVGKCELSWAPNQSVPGTAATGDRDGVDVNMEGSPTEPMSGTRADVDYDVADDDERWLVG